MPATVLVANRGEIAVRIFRTLRRLGMTAAAVYSDADAAARHVREADVAVRLGPPPAAASYLDVGAVVGAALRVGARAVHPGYGFLSENPALARACLDAGVVFVGPPAAAIEAMGDKIRAKGTASAAGVPVVPGRSGAGLGDDELAAAALEVGLPVLLKPSAGGGGKGMRRVEDEHALLAEIAAARREARGAFGDDTLLVERWVARPRHIEVQVLADGHGNVVHLGERECSLQRRHQKVVEEAPSVLLDAATRRAMGASAVAVARAVGYVGAGTVEFIVSADRPGEHFFMEMNTRLQVEHPVTEAVTGLDLVEWQLRIAEGEPLDFTQEDVRLSGHAVEARVYAEDPDRGFLPASGRLRLWREPARHGVRVDSGVATGDDVPTEYDPMLAKVIARGATRDVALARLDRALAATAALGVTTNVGFLRRLLHHPEVSEGRLDTELIERDRDALRAGEAPDDVFAAAALYRLLRASPAGPGDPWDDPTGWRVGGRAEVVLDLECAGRGVSVGARGGPGRAEVRVGPAAPEPASARLVGGDLLVAFGGVAKRWALAEDGDCLWLGADGDAWKVRMVAGEASAGADAGGGGGLVRSPMPGTVRVLHAAVGDRVEAGAALVTVEAMKMEYVVPAPAGGTVVAVRVRAGQAVALDEELAEVSADGKADPA